MSAGNFDKCLPAVLREEGGNDDDPNDHGGRTSRGIIQREYDAYRRRKGLPKLDVWRASNAEVREIYETQYWQPWCEKLPIGLDLVYFDFAVNAGGLQANKSLQRALGNVAVDGRMGIVTLAAIEECADIRGLIVRFSNQRRAFYRALAQFPRYGKGWMSRTARIQSAAMAMASTGREAPPQPVADAGKAKAAREETAEAPVSPETGAVVATGGAATTGVLQQAQEQLQPLGYSIAWVQVIVIVLTVAILGVTLYGLWKRRKAKQAV